MGLALADWLGVRVRERDQLIWITRLPTSRWSPGGADGAAGAGNALGFLAL
jgi:hypothetical protein